MPSRVFVASLLTSCLVFASQAASQQEKSATQDKKPAPKAPLKAANFQSLSDALEVPLETKQFHEPVKFKEFAEWLTYQFADRGVSVPLVIDRAAFLGGDDPGAPDPCEQQVSLPTSTPAKLKAGQILRILLPQVGKNAAYLIRNGVIEITIHEFAAPERLLGYPVRVRFDKKPLDEAIEALCEMSGATIVIDPRVGEKARTPVSATFRNNITLEGATRLLAEMADLQADVQENVLFITSKPKVEAPAQKTELRLKNRRIDLAVRDLANWSGESILLDPAFVPPPTPLDIGHGQRRPPLPAGVADQIGGMGMIGMGAPDPMHMKITAAFKPNVPAKSAAEVIARQAGLSVIVMDNLIYITHPFIGVPFPSEKAGPVAPGK